MCARLKVKEIVMFHVIDNCMNDSVFYVTCRVMPDIVSPSCV